MVHTLRPCDQNANDHLSNPGSNLSNSDLNNSRASPPSQTKKRDKKCGQDSISRDEQRCGQGGETSYPQKAMETEKVDLNTKCGQDQRQGENATLFGPRDAEVEGVYSHMDFIGEKEASCAQIETETEMVESSIKLILRNGLVGSGVDLVDGNTAQCSAKVMETKPVDAAVYLIAGKTKSSTPTTVETETVHSVDPNASGIRGHERGGKGRKRGRHGSGWGVGGTRLGIQGTRSLPSQERSAKRDTSKETDNPGPSPLTEKGPSSPEVQAAQRKRDSSSFRKKVDREVRELKRRRTFSYVPQATARQSDDTCPVCADLGDLTCCAKCPSTYHLSCLNQKRRPTNDWLCPYCICKVCRGDEELIQCSQCNKNFHWVCLKETEKEFSIHCSRLYCGPGCREIYEKLDCSLGIKHDLVESFSWRVIHPVDMKSKALSASEDLRLENNSKLRVACMLLSGAFEPIKDKVSGINVVQSMVYSRESNSSRINYRRFYTFILEKDDEIVAAALVRFPGGGIAEMPFIATKEAYRRNGFCESLMSIIESFLCKVKVKNFIIPSMAENGTVAMWKSKYNFTEVMTKKLKEEISSCNIVMFHLAVRLNKNLSNYRNDNMERAIRPLRKYLDRVKDLTHGER